MIINGFQERAAQGYGNYIFYDSSKHHYYIYKYKRTQNGILQFQGEGLKEKNLRLFFYYSMQMNFLMKLRRRTIVKVQSCKLTND